jgi:ABC-type uncharacterized transport system substrate-binding protein
MAQTQSPLDALNPAPAEGQAKRGFRIIYVEAGPYRDYALNLASLAMGLAELGLIASPDVPAPEGEDAELIWRWLSEKSGGDKLVFLKDGFYSAAWDDKRYPALKRAILTRLRSGEVDLVLAFGTVAGLAMATDEHNVPVMSITATDPIAAGISKTVERSGLDHVHVQVEVDKIKRQLGMFHQFFGFEVLGVPYDATDSGRATIGVESIERSAMELGFSVLPCVAQLELPSAEESQKNLAECLKLLSEKCDAIYLTASNGAAESALKTLLAPVMAKKLPTFSQKGPSDTERGVLMSLAEDDFATSGRFEAKILKAILEGEKPGSLKQTYVPPLTIALNFQTALDIGWNPPFELLSVVDELYPHNWSNNPKDAAGLAENPVSQDGAALSGSIQSSPVEAGAAPPEAAPQDPPNADPKAFKPEKPLPGQTAPGQVDPSHAAASQTDPSQADSSQANSGQAGHNQTGASQSGPSQAGVSETDSSQTAATQTGSAR